MSTPDPGGILRRMFRGPVASAHRAAPPAGRVRRAWAWAWASGLALLLVGCGGGSGAESPGGGDPAVSSQGTREVRTIGSALTGTSYPLSLYVPPTSAGPRGGMPVIYVLDGESWFETLAGIVESARLPIIVVGVGSAGQRNRDFVPANRCTGGGGGNAAYFDFLRRELLPYVQQTVGGDASRRALFGHSHGGSFVLYALFSEPAGSQVFSAYLPSDSSVSCMPDVAEAWEQAYAARYRDLPVRLHLSYASQGNAAANQAYADVIARRGYQRLTYQAQGYEGTHGGIVPRVLADVVGFAFSAAP